MVELAPGTRPLRRHPGPRPPPAPGPSTSRAPATCTPPGSTTPRSRWPPGVDVEVMLAEGVPVLRRAVDLARAAGDTAAVDILEDAVAALQDTEPPRGGPPRPGGRPRGRGRRRPPPGARPRHRLGAAAAARSSASWPCSAPGTSCSRAARAPAATPRRTAGSPAPSARRPSGCPRSRGWASTSSTCRRSTPSARSTARAATTPSTRARATPARRGRSGPRTAATTPSTPTWATEEDFAYFVGKAKEVGLEVALDLALQAAPDHPWATEHPEWFTTRIDGTIAYAENPPKKYQDIYPVNFDNDPEGIYAEVLRIVELWVGRGVTVFRVDNPHTKPVEFWEWLIGRVNAAHPEVALPRRGLHPPADDADARQGRLPAVVHVLHVAHVQGRSSPTTSPSCRRSPRTTCGRASGRARRTSSTRPCSTAGPRRTGCAPSSRRRWSRAGASTPPTSWASTSPARAPRSTSTTRSSSTARATGPPPRPRAARWPRCSPGSTRSGARTRRCSGCAGRRSTGPTTTWSSPTPGTSRPRSPPPGAPTPCSSWSTSTRTRPTRRPCTSTPRRSACRRTASTRCTTCSAGTRGAGAARNYVRLDPYDAPAHVFAVRAH